jgi:hypothetical protein
MSLYVRAVTHVPALRSARTLKIATTWALVAYPLGCALRLLAPEAGGPGSPGFVLDAGGLALIVSAVIAFIVVAPSSWQRIVGEEEKLLDERELQQRYKAQAFGYSIFTVLAVLFAFYMEVSIDLETQKGVLLWRPSTADHWNAFIWGGLLYAFVLPTAYLAWTQPAPPEEE